MYLLLVYSPGYYFVLGTLYAFGRNELGSAGFTEEVEGVYPRPVPYFHVHNLKVDKVLTAILHSSPPKLAN